MTPADTPRPPDGAENLNELFRECLLHDDDLHVLVGYARAELAALRASAERAGKMQEIVEVYAQHKDDCEAYRVACLRIGQPLTCICGLDFALADAAARAALEGG